MLPSPLHLQTSDAPAGLHSFPTRRSSDLWLDQQLRDAAPYIDDDGFTARVLQKLPAPGRQRQSLRAVILIGMTLLASTFAYVLSDSGRFISVSVERLAMLPMLWLFALALGSGI